MTPEEVFTMRAIADTNDTVPSRMAWRAADEIDRLRKELEMKKARPCGCNEHVFCAKCGPRCSKHYGFIGPQGCLVCLEEGRKSPGLSPEAQAYRDHIQAPGQKHDAGKRRWSLLPVGPLGIVVDVLTFGALKYAPNQWQKVETAEERYTDAMLRHITAWTGGERNDPESGLHHLAHAICCALFLLWFEGKKP